MKRFLPLFLLFALSVRAQEVRRVDTLTQLLAVNPATVATGAKLTYEVGGRVTRGDWGNPRLADWDSASTVTTNDFNFTAIGTGRWVFRDNRDRTIDARIFGVVPHYATSRQDNSGTDNTVAIQRGMDYLASLGGGVLEFPAASYKMGAVVVPPRVWIEGASGGMYNQAYQTNAIGLSGTTRFYPPPGFAGDMWWFRGSDGAALAPAQTTFNSGDGSTITNYMHGSGLRNIAIDSGYAGLRGREIFIDSCFGVELQNVGHYPYGALDGLYVWGSNLVKVKNYVGLQRLPLYWIYSADNRMLDVDVGGTSGSVLWLHGAKNNIGDSTFFNAQAQPNSVRPTFSADASTDTITISDATAGRYWFTELPVTIENSGGTLPAPLATNTVYYLIRVSDTQFKLNTQRDRYSGGTTGAKQGTALNITTAGTGTFTIGPGPVANAYVKEYDHNQFTNVRFDQSYGPAVVLDGAHDNSFENCYFTESGWTSSSSAVGAIHLYGQSHNNQFSGSVRNRDSVNSHAAYGLVSDGGGTNNYWLGPLVGVTNVFGSNPNSFVASRWNGATKELESAYSGTWRRSQTLPVGMMYPNYEDYAGVLTMFAPFNGIYAGDFGSTNANETLKITATSTNATQGPIESYYRYGGVAGAPTAVAANSVIMGQTATAYNGSSLDYSIASVLAWTESAVSAISAPTRIYWYTTGTNSVTRQPRMGLLSTGTLLVTPEGISGFPAYASSIGMILDSTTTAFVPSRLTTTQRDALVATNGMVIYNSTLSAFQGYAGGWVTFASGTPLTIEDVQDNLGTSFIVAGTGITKTYDDVANTLTLSSTAAVTVNGASVSSPNFKNSATVTISVAGSDVTFAANGSTNASQVKVDGSNVNDPDFVNSAEIDIGATGSSVSASLIAGSVAYSKIQNVTASRVLGRGNSGAGAPQELTLSGATISGTTLSIDAQESTNVLVNGAKVTKANLKNTSTVTWTSLGSDISAVSTVADGDKGDITVSSSGAVYTIDPATVTYSKIQNTSAASVLIGRGAGAGAGSVQEITLGSGLSMSGTTLSATGGGSGITKFGSAKFRLIGPGPYSLDNTAYTGAVNGAAYGGGDSTNPAKVDISFSSAASSTNYLVQVAFEEDNPASDAETYAWKIVRATKTTSGFRLEIAITPSYAAPGGLWCDVWVMQ